jgi:predicted transcriptional regulator
MSTISLRLPDSLHKRVRKLAQEEQVSINQLITTAVAEKLSALMTESYLSARAKRGSRAKFDRVLKKVKPRPPMTGDVAA